VGQINPPKEEKYKAQHQGCFAIPVMTSYSRTEPQTGFRRYIEPIPKHQLDVKIAICLRRHYNVNWVLKEVLGSTELRTVAGVRRNF
jgi:hypothetical protein